MWQVLNFGWVRMTGSIYLLKLASTWTPSVWRRRYKVQQHSNEALVNTSLTPGWMGESTFLCETLSPPSSIPKNSHFIMAFIFKESEKYSRIYERYLGFLSGGSCPHGFWLGRVGPFFVEGAVATSVTPLWVDCLPGAVMCNQKGVLSPVITI